jgi:hypothetical protein
VKTVVVSEFKAQCNALLKEMNLPGEPLLITLRVKPLARIDPALSGQQLLGAQKDSTISKVDLAHCDFSEDWESGE